MFALFCIFVGASAGRFAATGQVMTGKAQRVPANEPDVLAAARFAVVEFNRADAEDRFAYRIVNVTSAKIQVVAGIKYILEVQLGRTVCKKSDTVDSEHCGFDSGFKCTMMGEGNNKQDQGMKEDTRQRSHVGLKTKTSQLTCSCWGQRLKAVEW